MKTVAPDYYAGFRCIAGACKHSCCAGWEVDIDSDTLARYEALEGPLGAELRENIEKDEAAHFRLTEGDRCPFLREDGLCRLILAAGEDILCQICRDHPRFRNYWNDRVETGLGLACEEAGRLILNRKEPMRLLTLEDDGQDEGLPEDEAWLMELREELLKRFSGPSPLDRLGEYLVYRHLADALYDGMPEGRIAFIRESLADMAEAWEKTCGTVDELVEIARQFSVEKEYNEEWKNGRIEALQTAFDIECGLK